MTRSFSFYILKSSVFQQKIGGGERGESLPMRISERTRLRLGKKQNFTESEQLGAEHPFLFLKTTL